MVGDPGRTLEDFERLFRNVPDPLRLVRVERTRLLRKRVFEQRMDAFQPLICRGPGPEWQAFAESLPGFVEFWEGSLETHVKRLGSVTP